MFRHFSKDFGPSARCGEKHVYFPDLSHHPDEVAVDRGCEVSLSEVELEHSFATYEHWYYAFASAPGPGCFYSVSIVFRVLQ